LFQVEVVTVEDVPAEFVAKEKEIESEKDDLAKKPPQIREKIVDGRVAKRLAELALLEQPYIRDDKILVKDLVKQTIAGLGEKVQIRRFVRYNLGEGLEKKSTDFAAEVAAQTAATVEAKPAVPQAPEVKEEKIEDSTPKVGKSNELVSPSDLCSRRWYEKWKIVSHISEFSRWQYQLQESRSLGRQQVRE
jgi:elongation factor Ts